MYDCAKKCENIAMCDYFDCSGGMPHSNYDEDDDDVIFDDLDEHHCSHCGEYWWEKGNICELCDNYFCPSYWQNNFIFDSSDYLECTPPDSLPDYGSICTPCFLSNLDYRCDCDSKCITSKSRWIEWEKIE